MYIVCIFSYYVPGRAVAQAVSRWLPTAAARVRVRAACGACEYLASYAKILYVCTALRLSNHQLIRQAATHVMSTVSGRTRKQCFVHRL
jgi:hypothetical protein